MSIEMSKPLIFIDWDDTLFPTDWVQSSNVNLDSPNNTTIEMFHELDKLITDMIVNMIMLGNVLLVTNGSQGWVDKCLRILPNFKEIVDDDIITVTSARDLHQHNHQTKEWKRLTFQMFFNEHISDLEGEHHILSFGDSSHEHEALMELKEHNIVNNQKRILKSVKFIKDPSLNQLVNQLELVRMLHEDIIQKETDHVFELKEFIL